MARRPGRPARRTQIEPQLLAATEVALVKLGRDLGLPTEPYVDPDTARTRTRPRPLDLAVLAIKAQEALEVLARQQVALGRDHDNLTWEDVGAAFDITMQSAHHRFAKPSPRRRGRLGDHHGRVRRRQQRRGHRQGRVGAVRHWPRP